MKYKDLLYQMRLCLEKDMNWINRIKFNLYGRNQKLMAEISSLRII
jgi:hypothetical protein